jgi:hypothetical protein
MGPAAGAWRKAALEVGGLAFQNWLCPLGSVSAWADPCIGGESAYWRDLFSS